MSSNLLDRVPVHCAQFPWEYSRSGQVVVRLRHRGFFHRLARLLGAPDESRVTLDEYGSYVWELMDGAHNVEEIAYALSARYGDEAEPLFERLACYLRSLCQNRLIELK